VLIKITNYCSLGCNHCLENSTVAGDHMTRETFLAALALTDRLEGDAWRVGIPKRILISGGEATEHPDVEWYLETVIGRGYDVILITNGMWLDDPMLRPKILRPEWKRLMVQVTNDPRFYPRQPTAVPTDDPRVVFVPTLSVLIPLGRMKPERAKAGTDGVPLRKGPTSFNLRSVTRSTGDVRAALTMLRARAALGMAGNCSPSISSDGTLVAGETNSCFPIGDVRSTADQVTRALVSMSCNKCGLVDNLTQEQKLAIGEARIVLP
jgi:hypothetical protein